MAPEIASRCERGHGCGQVGGDSDPLLLFAPVDDDLAGVVRAAAAKTPAKAAAAK